MNLLRNKRLCSLLSILVLVSCGCRDSEGAKLPDSMQPGVRIGSNRVRKTLLLKLTDVAAVTDLQYGELRTPSKFELGIAGNYGAKFFDSALKPNAAVAFTPPEPGGFRVSAKIVKQSASDPLAFFRQAGPAATYDSLTHFSGKEIWRTPYHAVSSSFASPRPGAPPEFIFATEHRTIETRDTSGMITWRGPQVGYAFSIAFVEAEDSNPAFIVLGDNDTGDLVRIHFQDSFLFRRKPLGTGEASYFASFSTVRWSPACVNECLLVSENSDFLLLSPEGAKLEVLGPAHYVMGAIGKSVRLLPDTAPFLAIAGQVPYQDGKLVGFTAVHGELYLFDVQRRLVYEEVLAEPVKALGILPAADGKGESLLVGGENKVWQYSEPGMPLL